MVFSGVYCLMATTPRASHASLTAHTATGGATHSFDTTTGIRQLSADGQSDEAYSISVMHVAKSSRGMV